MKQMIYKDHLGNVYPSFNKMCSAYDMLSGTVRWRLGKGWDLEKALTYKTEVEFKGETYNSLTMLCKTYNIGSDTQSKIAKGEINLEEAVERAISITDGRTDHMGRKFSSVQKMCDFWGIDRDCYIGRLRTGWDKEKALVTSVNKGVTDFNGMRYRSLSNLSYCYRLSQEYVESKMLEGLTLNDVLKAYGNIDIDGLKYIDHIGNRFYTIDDMCNHWGIDMDLYKSGIAKGKDFNSILKEEIELENSSKDNKDAGRKIWHAPNGKQYTSFRKMCKDYGVCTETARKRLKKGCSLSEALANVKYYTNKNNKLKEEKRNEF